MTTGKWIEPGVPHKGWECISWYDWCDDHDELRICEMCERQHIRYVHVMRHCDYPDDLDVGCVCAENMEQGYKSNNSRARTREGGMRRRDGRRKKWLSLKAWKKNHKGNWVIRKSGLLATVFCKSGNWKYVIRDQFSTRSYSTEDQARLALFDVFDKISNPSDYPPE